GVGLAAIQYCKAVGANVYGTAGSQHKQDFLRQQGVHLVTSSRDASQFQADMHKANSKMNVVLNCLIEDFIPFSLDAMAPKGRFMELGKRGIWSKEEVLARRPDLAMYEAIAVDHMMEQDPKWFGAMLDRVRGLVDSGKIKPIPLHTFDMSTADNVTGGIAAFRFMQRAQHIGKVIIQIPSAIAPPHTDDAQRHEATPADRQTDGCYVITGGLGGLGLLVADWLVDEGAKHIVLLSRRGKPPPSIETSAIWQKLTAPVPHRKTNVQVHCMPCDVSDRQACADLLDKLRAKLPSHPVKGIFHAAGAIDDAKVINQTRDRIEAVYLPKVMGAMHLHELSVDTKLPLGHFVMFSSVASLFGNFGQSNYSAANSCLDALTEYRRSKKLAAQSIQWGPWTEHGMAADFKSHLDKVGMRGVTNDLGLRVLGDVMRHSERVGVTCCQALKWHTFLSKYDVIPPFYETVASAATGGAAAGVSAELRNMDAAALKEHIHKTVVETAATVLGMTEAPPLDSPLQELGIDSLGAVEFRNALSSKIGVKLPATTLFDYPTLNAIIGFICSEISGGIDEAAGVDDTGVPVPVAMSESLAVVGVSCRLPGGVTTPSSFWSMLMNRTDCVDEVPLTRWNVDEVYDADPDAKGKCYTRKAAFMDAADMFDNAFFNIGPAEVQSMDPQQRLMLEVGYEAFHSAGLSREKLIGQDLAVFIGCCNQDWNFIDLSDKSSSYSGTGGASSIVSNRLSYVFGLKGPSMTIDTACSSSLVAMDAAVKNTRMGVCRGALVGGVNLMLSPHLFIAFSKARMLSPDCKCKTFDAKANGYVRGEGAGAVVLRRASDVEAMKLQRIATVLGSSVNHDGRSASLTAPNGPAQQEAIKSALNQAGLKPSAVSYIETHGTGTSLGDPIEFGALQAVFGPGRSDNNPLVLGALKTNIGHLEGSAGISGLVNLIMTLLHSRAAPNLHFTQLNPYISMNETFPVVFPTEPVPLVSGLPGKDRMVGGVSSFGFGGANAHILVEAKALSAAQIDEMLNKDKASAALQNKIGFMFTGQGSQYVDMGRKLYDNEKVFRECIDQCATILDPLLPVPLTGILYPKNDKEKIKMQEMIDQ
ncbi:unnamed protein product, partial [Vitrella brassicaformis CCMP3155]